MAEGLRSGVGVMWRHRLISGGSWWKRRLDCCRGRARLSGALTSAFYGIAVKRTAGKIHPVALICWQSWASWPFLAILSGCFETDRSFTFTGRAAAAILYLGLISAAFGFVAFAWLLQRNATTRVTALTFLTPVACIAGSAR